LEDYRACVLLQEETWGAGFSERVPGAILRVAQYVGGVSAGAFDASGAMVGFVFGLTGVRDGALVHWSDMLAVRRQFRGRHIGERLKHYQWEKVSALGVTSMLWTYDPLMAANAHFNINRLGARPIEYVPDMYGSNTGSALHGPLPTDRFIVRWAPGEPLAQPPADAPDVQAPLVNPLATDEGPTEWIEPSPTAAAYRVQIPADWDAVRSAGGESARRWRSVVRDAVTTLLAHGYRVDAFDRGAADHLPSYRFVR
jgi:predicted GNAT superfamily acetyltransferase